MIENIKAVNAEVPSIITGYRMTKEQRKALLTKETLSKNVAEKIEASDVFGKDLGSIKINGFDVTYRDDKEEINLLPEVHENVTDYPENSAMGDVPAYGIYIRHADCEYSNVHVVPRSMNTIECIVEE